MSDTLVNYHTTRRPSSGDFQERLKSWNIHCQQFIEVFDTCRVIPLPQSNSHFHEISNFLGNEEIFVANMKPGLRRSENKLGYDV